MGKYISVEIEKCLGCKTCELACAIEHSETKDLEKTVRSGEKPGYRINVEHYKGKSIPVNCSHCEDPMCVIACPSGALKKDAKDGRVTINAEICIGCKMCVQACPFGVITVRKNGKGVLKCDLCIERFEHGEEPACVASCPTRALKLSEEDKENKTKRQNRAKEIAESQEKEKK
ncbi:4Fe-4S dicluster domain-containing protein [Spirochaetota bacterium]